ncbi:MAG: hypothetical protein NC930_08830 [Candidatus Omnitrophica bacterium]|nr:hypothetical protein [Candidatus Omnitrophota bacterium]
MANSVSEPQSDFDSAATISVTSDGMDTSIRFLMDQALSKPSRARVNDAEPERFDKTAVRKVNKRKTIDVPQQRNNHCREMGNRQKGSLFCVHPYSDGSFREVIIHYLREGNIYRRQTLTTDFAPDGRRLDRKSVLQKVIYDTSLDVTAKKVEYFDIIIKPYRGPKTRQWVIVQYHSDRGHVERITWAKYRQIGKTDFGEITYHANLTYDHMGQPVRGRVEKWQNEEIANVFLDWKAQSHSTPGLEKGVWNRWENWLHKIIRSAVYP